MKTKIVVASAMTALVISLSLNNSKSSANSHLILQMNDSNIIKKAVDSDNDGVPDLYDKCPNTPRGTTVDAQGCPVALNESSDLIYARVIDSDDDGVPDLYDKCPNTPRGTTVDAYGCPVALNESSDLAYVKVTDSDIVEIDSDNDGIPDKYDCCPNTPVGTHVDSTGCPINF